MAPCARPARRAQARHRQERRQPVPLAGRPRGHQPDLPTRLRPARCVRPAGRGAARPPARRAVRRFHHPQPHRRPARRCGAVANHARRAGFHPSGRPFHCDQEPGVRAGAAAPAGRHLYAGEQLGARDRPPHRFLGGFGDQCPGVRRSGPSAVSGRGLLPRKPEPAIAHGAANRQPSDQCLPAGIRTGDRPAAGHRPGRRADAGTPARRIAFGTGPDRSGRLVGGARHAIRAAIFPVWHSRCAIGG